MLVCATVAIALAVGRRARRDGILVPLVAGVLLRLVVMLIAHAGSLSLGDHGILFVDDKTHYDGASYLAGLWRDGHFPNPASVGVLGTFQFGYPAFVGVIFALGTTSILLGKLANVLLGGITIFLTARIAGNVLGERAKLRAAWIAALAPSLVWWSASMMKEALATALVMLAVLAITELPRRKALLAFGAVLAALMVVRTSGVLALVIGAGLAIAIAGRQVDRKWLSRPLLVFAAAAGGCLVVAVLVVSRGDLPMFYNQYHEVVNRMVNLYQGSDPARIPFDAVKSLVTPLPWTFDDATRNWDRGLYPGVWLLFCALPLAALGAWRLRRRPEGWLLIGTTAVTLLINAFTSGFVFRQRSMVEPLLLLLALAGTRSWRMAARTAAASLAVVAVVAGVQSRSLVVALAIAAAAAAVFLVSRWLPARPFEPLPESRMVARFRDGVPATPAGEGLTSWPLATTIARVLGRVLAALAAVRSGLEGRAPRLNEPVPPEPAPAVSAAAGRVRAFVRRTAPRVPAPGSDDAATDAKDRRA